MSESKVSKRDQMKKDLQEVSIPIRGREHWQRVNHCFNQTFGQAKWISERGVLRRFAYDDCRSLNVRYWIPNKDVLSLVLLF